MGHSLRFACDPPSLAETEGEIRAPQPARKKHEVFGAPSNCRNFKNWHFAPLPGPDCEPTHAPRPATQT